MKTVRVMISDDHAILRESLRTLINAQIDLEVIGEAGNVSETLEVLGEKQPDVLLLDLSIPGGGGIKILETLRKNRPKTQILVLTMHDDIAYVCSALREGANGYVLKEANSSELLSAIQTVARGGLYVDKALSQDVLQTVFMEDAKGYHKKRGELVPKLSPREFEVMRLIVLGHTGAEISQELGIKTKTVESHRANIFQKLKLKTRAELVRFALNQGVFSKEIPTKS